MAEKQHISTIRNFLWRFSFPIFQAVVLVCVILFFSVLHYWKLQVVPFSVVLLGMAIVFSVGFAEIWWWFRKKNKVVPPISGPPCIVCDLPDPGVECYYCGFTANTANEDVELLRKLLDSKQLIVAQDGLNHIELVELGMYDVVMEISSGDKPIDQEDGLRRYDALIRKQRSFVRKRGLLQ